MSDVGAAIGGGPAVATDPASIVEHLSTSPVPFTTAKVAELAGCSLDDAQAACEAAAAAGWCRSSSTCMESVELADGSWIGERR